MRYGTDSQVRLASLDVKEGIRRADIWLMLGWQDIRQRYRRSALGPFWLTLSTGITTVALGFVFSLLFKSPHERYFPYLAVGLVAWSLISTIMIDGCMCFIHAEATIKQIRLPFTMYACRLVWRNVAIFLHNLVIVIGVMLWFGIAGSAWAVPLVLPGLFIVLLNGLWMALTLGLICARFRDVPQIVTSGVQLVFFVTPIIWEPSLMPGRNRIIHFNPFHHLVELVRAPLLGYVPATESWLLGIGTAVVGWLFAFALLVGYRRRIAYWL